MPLPGRLEGNQTLPERSHTQSTSQQQAATPTNTALELEAAKLILTILFTLLYQSRFFFAPSSPRRRRRYQASLSWSGRHVLPGGGTAGSRQGNHRGTDAVEVVDGVDLRAAGCLADGWEEVLGGRVLMRRELGYRLKFLSSTVVVVLRRWRQHCLTETRRHTSKTCLTKYLSLTILTVRGEGGTESFAHGQIRSSKSRVA